MYEFEDFCKIQEEPIYGSDSGVSYYPCRAPDNKSYLMVELDGVDFFATMSDLCNAEKAGLKMNEYPTRSDCRPETCHCKRECSKLTFLPALICQSKPDKHWCVIGFKCYDVSKLIQVSKLVEIYYLETLTAYRVAMSLSVLVNYLVTFGIEVDFSIENLLIDLESSYCTLLDWSKAQFNASLKASRAVDYYHSMARIMIKLVDGIVMDFDDIDGTSACHYVARAEPNNAAMRRLLSIMEDVLKIRCTLSSECDVCNVATDYTVNLQRQLNRISQEILDVASMIKVANPVPLYELKERQKKEE